MRQKFPSHRPLAVLRSKARSVDARIEALAAASPQKASAVQEREGAASVSSFAQVAAASGVVPLARGDRHVPLPEREVGVRTARRAEFQVTADDAWLEGARRGVAASVLGRLRGRPRATLDLHGLRVAVAERRLLAFLAAENAAGKSLVLVIVGKGRHSPGGAGVLRGAIGEWLTAGPAAAHVLAFRTAPPALGGNGGVLVLLRGAASR